MPDDGPMTIEEERRLYLDGIDLFNRGEFFAAHESWEKIWKQAAGARQGFYQGLIQCAVALEHYRRSNPRGVVSTYQNFLPKFRALPPQFMGLMVPMFLAQMRGVLRPVVDASPLPGDGQIELDLSRVPKIVLDYDPFESGEAAQLRGGG
jgi:hypothetical protein